MEYSVMVCGELWSERVMIYYVENTPGAWANPTNIRLGVDQMGPAAPALALVVAAARVWMLLFS